MDQQLQATPPNPTPIGFKNIQLFKEDTLGIGSYGKVCRAKCDNLLCAAKIIHETLFDPKAAQQTPRGHEHRLPIRRFEQECEFLNTIRHPNVIQYLGMCRDPDTGLLVLLMELMDKSLTHFLEAATRSIPYHIQVNICHDIALALTFLHANGIIHRDLSSNNVLLISNIRAKVTDFGMAKLGDLNPRASRLTFTMCPGTDVYMPPEAVQDQPIYMEKIDCFSFGVIVVQVLTRQFPKPGDRMQRVETNHSGLPRGTLMVCIPEVDRRQDHISQIHPNNTLLPIALNCLKDRDVERPSAQQLCERVAALKESDAYGESIRAVQMTITQRDMQEQLLSLRAQHTREIEHLQETQAREKQSLRDDHVTEIQNLREIQLREHEGIIAAKEHEIQDLLQSHNEAIATRKRAIQQLRVQLEQTTHKMNERDQIIEELEGQLKRIQLDLPSKDQTQIGAKGGLQKFSDMKLTWRMGKPAPRRIYRICNAVVDKTMVYFNADGNYNEIYCYNTSSDLWTRMADCPNSCSSFVVINNMLTAIGGGAPSNKLYSLKGGAWIEEFPPIPTKRSSATVICTESSLIVIGGVPHRLSRSPVEVLSMASHQWFIAAHIKEELRRASGVNCGDQLYVLGALDSKSVYTCSLSDLLRSCQLASESMAAPPRQSTMWRKVADLPLYNSTCVSLYGHLLAIGGETEKSIDISSTSSKAVYAYKPATDSWEVISRMSVSRCQCFAVTLPTNNKLMVVGGYQQAGYSCTDSVEFANILL